MFVSCQVFCRSAGVLPYPWIKASGAQEKLIDLFLFRAAHLTGDFKHENRTPSDAMRGSDAPASSSEIQSFCRLGTTSHVSLAKPCFFLPERADDALEADIDCLSGLSCNPVHDDRLGGGTVQTPDEVTGHICCSCGRLFLFRKSRMGWDLDIPTVMVAKIEADGGARGMRGYVVSVAPLSVFFLFVPFCSTLDM